ncbi:helix-turn-helix domain-containing protein [Flavobacterium sp. GNP001]
MNFYENAKDSLSRIESNVVEMSAKMKLGYRLNPENIFFDSQEFMQLMNISKRTAQQWRDNKVIGFSQVGNKIYYSLSDILNLLKENYNPKKETLK